MANDHLPIHLCDYASQPYIRIYCDQAWCSPGWNQPDEGDPPGCWLTDENPPRKYTFDFWKVTCKLCNERFKEVNNHAHR